MHFCHTSEKNVTKLAETSATLVSGRTAKKSSRKPSSCDWSDLHAGWFWFFSLKITVKTSATTFGKNEKNWSNRPNFKVAVFLP